MRASLRILTGHRAGLQVTPAAQRFLAGRHADAQLRFDPEHDLSVSSRHAEFFEAGDTWYVRDLGARNGTFVNGSAVTNDTQLHDGDVITFGRNGPQAEVRLVAGAVREDTGQRVRAAVRRETRLWRIAAGTAIALTAAFSIGLLILDRRERAAWEVERVALQLRVDSLIEANRRAERSLQGEVTGLTSALRASEDQLRRLATELRTTRAGGVEAEAIERQLLSAGAALRRQQLAASLDFAAIQRRNRGAVAMIWVEYTDGTRATGTAFAVRADGLLLTNRHLVLGPAGDRTPGRIAIRFSDSDQAFPARLVAASRRWDLAAVRVANVIGDVPTVGALNLRTDTIQAGAPVALIGFPLGGEPPGGPDAVRVARPVVSAGLTIARSDNVIQLQGLGAAGGSGSPILDAAGDVIAVLYGGRVDDGTQILLAIPAPAAATFLRGID